MAALSLPMASRTSPIPAWCPRRSRARGRRTYLPERTFPVVSSSRRATLAMAAPAFADELNWGTPARVIPTSVKERMRRALRLRAPTSRGGAGRPG